MRGLLGEDVENVHFCELALRFSDRAGVCKGPRIRAAEPSIYNNGNTFFYRN